MRGGRFDPYEGAPATNNQSTFFNRRKETQSERDEYSPGPDIRVKKADTKLPVINQHKASFFQSMNKKIIDSDKIHDRIQEEHLRQMNLRVEQENQEREEYLQHLYKYKPWLKTCVPKLKTAKIDFMMKNYPVTEEEVSRFEAIKDDPEAQAQLKAELDFIRENIEHNKHDFREKKSDIQLMLDFRFTHNYGQFLYDRIKLHNHRERLNLPLSGAFSKGAVKKAFHKLALIWHPDNINKKHRFCFAN
jgi:hypothetical protein